MGDIGDFLITVMMVVVAVPLVLIVIYLVVRFGSAAWFKSKREHAQLEKKDIGPKNSESA
jgi:flagellar biogenesis protein FliO